MTHALPELAAETLSALRRMLDQLIAFAGRPAELILQPLSRADWSMLARRIRAVEEELRNALSWQVMLVMQLPGAHRRVKSGPGFRDAPDASPRRADGREPSFRFWNLSRSPRTPTCPPPFRGRNVVAPSGLELLPLQGGGGVGVNATKAATRSAAPLASRIAAMERVLANPQLHIARWAGRAHLLPADLRAEKSRSPRRPPRPLTPAEHCARAERREMLARRRMFSGSG